MSFYRQQLEDWLKTLDVKADVVLDWGGAQKPVRGRTKSWDVREYIIWDTDEDIENTYLENKLADLIFVLEVFEYLLEPLLAMENIFLSLRMGGTVYISAPLIYPIHNEVELDSLRYTENGLIRLADNAGLNHVNTVYRYAATPTLQRYYAEDGMRAAKSMPHNITGYIMEFTK